MPYQRGARRQQQPQIDEKDLIKFTGSLTKFLFKSTDSSWGIALLEIDDSFVQIVNQDKPKTNERFQNASNSIKCVGNFSSSTIGVSLEITGHWKVDPKFGLQFAIIHSKLTDNIISEQLSADAQRKLLISFPGVGEVTAAKIVNLFKGDARKLTEDLKEGAVKISAVVSPEVRKNIVEGWETLGKKAAILGWLYDLDLGPGIADRVLSIYDGRGWNHDLIKEKIRENPYRMIDDIRGVGFIISDRVALKLGYPADSDFRKIAAMEFILADAAQNGGHTWVLESDLMNACLKLISQPMFPLSIPKGNAAGVLDNPLDESISESGGGSVGDIMKVMLPWGGEKTADRFHILQVRTAVGKQRAIALSQYVKNEWKVADVLAEIVDAWKTDKELRKMEEKENDDERVRQGQGQES